MQGSCPMMILINGKYAAKLSADSLIYFLVINRAVFFASLGPQLHANLAQEAVGSDSSGFQQTEELWCSLWFLVMNLEAHEHV